MMSKFRRTFSSATVSALITGAAAADDNDDDDSVMERFVMISSAGRLLRYAVVKVDAIVESDLCP